MTPSTAEDQQELQLSLQALTLSDGSQIGSQPAHMELAAIIIGLALRR